MMKMDEIIELDKKYFMNVFGDRTPVSFEYGRGMNLWDIHGKKYIDLLAGLAVSSVGHSHPKIVNAIKEQAEKLLHCSNLYYIEKQTELAKILVENSCADKVFFSNSGAEANEGAIKLARIYHKKKNNSHRYEIITLENSFHGRTLATVAATGQDKYQEPYLPLTPGFIRVPINDLKTLKDSINESTCAIMLEPIQGESGVNIVSSEYMKAVRKLCNEKDILLIFDEIQCGMGRTGKLFSYQHFDIEPDIFTIAKALAGGIPIGALCAKDFVAQAFEPGDHGSTFGGNPFSCAVGIAVMDILLNDKMIENSEMMGEYFLEKLNELKQKHSSIMEVRGKGLMIAIEFFDNKAKEVKNKCFEKGYLVGTSGDRIIRFLPPLIITEEDIDGMVTLLDVILNGFVKN